MTWGPVFSAGSKKDLQVVFHVMTGNPRHWSDKHAGMHAGLFIKIRGVESPCGLSRDSVLCVCGSGNSQKQDLTGTPRNVNSHNHITHIRQSTNPTAQKQNMHTDLKDLHCHSPSGCDGWCTGVPAAPSLSVVALATQILTNTHIREFCCQSHSQNQRRPHKKRAHTRRPGRMNEASQTLIMHFVLFNAWLNLLNIKPLQISETGRPNTFECYFAQEAWARPLHCGNQPLLGLSMQCLACEEPENQTLTALLRCPGTLSVPRLLKLFDCPSTLSVPRLLARLPRHSLSAEALSPKPRHPKEPWGPSTMSKLPRRV